MVGIATTTMAETILAMAACSKYVQLAPLSLDYPAPGLRPASGSDSASSIFRPEMYTFGMFSHAHTKILEALERRPGPLAQRSMGRGLDARPDRLLPRNGASLQLITTQIPFLQALRLHAM